MPRAKPYHKSRRASAGPSLSSIINASPTETPTSYCSEADRAMIMSTPVPAASIQDEPFEDSDTPTPFAPTSTIAAAATPGDSASDSAPETPSHFAIGTFTCVIETPDGTKPITYNASVYIEEIQELPGFVTFKGLARKPRDTSPAPVDTPAPNALTADVAQ